MADGVADPHAVTTAYLRLARAHGAEVRYRRAVTAVERAGPGWLVSAGPDRFAAGLIVNAAGGWAGEVAALAGLDVPVAHSRRTIYASAAGMDGRRLPMTIDVATGVYLRSEGERVLIGGPGSPRSAGDSTEVDWPWLEELLLKGVPRFPWLAELPLDRKASWAGTYEITPDHQGILGLHPGRADLGQRLRVLRPRVHAVPGDRATRRRRGDRRGRSRTSTWRRCASSGSPRWHAWPGGRDGAGDGRGRRRLFPCQPVDRLVPWQPVDPPGAGACGPPPGAGPRPGGRPARRCRRRSP